jgi:hypothetical protein
MASAPCITDRRRGALFTTPRLGAFAGLVVVVETVIL